MAFRPLKSAGIGITRMHYIHALIAKIVLNAVL
jgi:hypothetical protein